MKITRLWTLCVLSLVTIAVNAAEPVKYQLTAD